jgi:hypothetical protein
LAHCSYAPDSVHNNCRYVQTLNLGRIASTKTWFRTLLRNNICSDRKFRSFESQCATRHFDTPLLGNF